MAYYKNYQPGDEIPASAARENEISRVLNQFSGLKPIVQKSGKNINTMINIVWSNEEPLKAYMPVSLKDYGTFGFAVPFNGKDQLVVIPQSNMTKGDIGTAAIMGATDAYINIMDTQHKFAKIGRGGLVSATSGPIKILKVKSTLKPDESEKKDPDKTNLPLSLCSVLIGVSSSDSFFGYFYVEDASTYDEKGILKSAKVRVIDLLHPPAAEEEKPETKEDPKTEDEGEKAACGYAIYKGEKYVVKSKEFEISESGYIFLSSAVEEGKSETPTENPDQPPENPDTPPEPPPPKTPGLIFLTDRPSDYSSVSYIMLARVSLKKDGSLEIKQEFFGGDAIFPTEEAKKYKGPFAVSFNDGKVEVSAGFANVNGFFSEVIGVTLDIKESYICVHASINEDDGSGEGGEGEGGEGEGGEGEKSPATIEITMSTPGTNDYPIAQIIKTKGDENENPETENPETETEAKPNPEEFEIIQFHVPVAMFMLTKPCPLARF